MVYKYVQAEVEIDLSEFDDDELLDELESRGLDLNSPYVSGDQMRELIEQLWLNRRTGKPYGEVIDQIIYYGLGKVI